MNLYPIPDELGDITPAQAQKNINAIHAESASDPQHPFLNGNHPQHQDYVEFMTELFAAKCKDMPKASQSPFLLEQIVTPTNKIEYEGTI